MSFLEVATDALFSDSDSVPDADELSVCECERDFFPSFLRFFFFFFFFEFACDSPSDSDAESELLSFPSFRFFFFFLFL